MSVSSRASARACSSSRSPNWIDWVGQAVAHAVDWTRPEATHDDLRGVAARTGPYVTTAVDGLAAGLLPRLARLDGTTHIAGCDNKMYLGSSLAEPCVECKMKAGLMPGVQTGADRWAVWGPREEAIRKRQEERRKEAREVEARVGGRGEAVGGNGMGAGNPVFREEMAASNGVVREE